MLESDAEEAATVTEDIPGNEEASGGGGEGEGGDGRSGGPESGGAQAKAVEDHLQLTY